MEKLVQSLLLLFVAYYTLHFSSSKSKRAVNSENVLISSFLSNTSFSSGINSFLTENNFLEVFGAGRTDGGT